MMSSSIVRLQLSQPFSLRRIYIPVMNMMVCPIIRYGADVQAEVLCLQNICWTCMYRKMALWTPDIMSIFKLPGQGIKTKVRHGANHK